ncbi:MAG: EF-P beta-lysylation protein EpmB [Spongiibacteraceae bacterium]
MIPLNAALWQTESWQQQMRNMIREPAELFKRLQLNTDERSDPAALPSHFPLRVTEAFVAKMQAGDWNDPLLLQILPQQRETQSEPGYTDDPLEEASANPAPGIIHKYHGRVLLITTSACAVHCRYCFRRNFPYGDNNPSTKDWQQALDYIAARPEINEVILSGGDPLAASDDYLARLTDRVAAIPHVDTLRVHSRLPVVLPARINDELIAILSESRLKTVLVAHCNHANELDTATAEAFDKLRRANIALFNQTVLLKGINDSSGALSELSRKLFRQGVTPYYLHLLDKVAGAQHFDIEQQQAQKLIAELALSVPGYLVPKLVKEEAGRGSKTLVGPL